MVAAAAIGNASALCVASLSFVMPMSSLVPIVLLLEVSASVLLVPSVWREVHMKFVLGLTASSIIAAPLGIAILQLVPAVGVSPLSVSVQVQ